MTGVVTPCSNHIAIPTLAGEHTIHLVGHGGRSVLIDCHSRDMTELICARDCHSQRSFCTRTSSPITAVKGAALGPGRNLAPLSTTAQHPIPPRGHATPTTPTLVV